MNANNIISVIILANEFSDDHILWEKACQKFATSIKYKTVNLTKNNWLEAIKNEEVDCFLAKPGGINDHFKQLYDERLQILVNELGYKVFPSLNEVLIYENKRYLSFWLNANNIPHPRTDVFYSKDEALDFLQSTQYPIVAKLNIGASGNGVNILKTKQDAENYLNKIFGKGITARTGPRLDRGGLLKRALYMLMHFEELKNKLKLYKTIASNPQKGFCIFQEFIPHQFEWRVVRIGDSFFAHKKMVKGEKASGSLVKGYENPPLSLLDFVCDITDKHKFFSQAVDVFETAKDCYLVNEMQCIFGQSDPYQMLVNGKPGRYLYTNGQWMFEEGMFNTNESYDLRVEAVIQHLRLNQIAELNNDNVE